MKLSGGRGWSGCCFRLDDVKILQGVSVDVWLHIFQLLQLLRKSPFLMLTGSKYNSIHDLLLWQQRQPKS